MYARRAALADVSTAGRQYYPTPAELANAQATCTANGFGTVGQPWNIEADGSTFEVPTDLGGMPGYTSGYMVRFGFGRGAFANFPPPAAGTGTSPQAGGAAVTMPVPSQPPVLIAPQAQPAAPAPPAAAVPAPGPAAAVAQIHMEDGSTALVPVQTSAVTAAPAGAGFDIAAFLKGLLAAPAMQPVEAQAAAAAAPYAPQVGLSLASAWMKAHQTQLLAGGAVVVGGVLVLRALRPGRRRR